jgi:hypothetical protein
MNVIDVLQCAIDNVDPSMSAEHAAWRAELVEARGLVCNVLNAANILGETLVRHGNWDDGCFYYAGRSAPELEWPIRNLDATVDEAQGGKSDG